MFMLIWGVKRGIFSNEAGQGSAPIAHAAAKTEEPAREGLVAMLGPYIDTLMICTLTGLTIVTLGVWKDKKPAEVRFTEQAQISVIREEGRIQPDGVIEEEDRITAGRIEVIDGKPAGAVFVKNHSTVDKGYIMRGSERFDGFMEITGEESVRFLTADGEQIDSGELVLSGEILLNGSPLTAFAFQRGLSRFFDGGNYIVSIAVFLFALSTAISWSYYGDRSVEYLLGRGAIMPYRIIFCVVHFLGAIFSLELVWGFGDTALGLMAIPNLIAILALSGKVRKMAKDYFSRY
jgi:AGCS family alanine or glycine:cation symporter